MKKRIIAFSAISLIGIMIFAASCEKKPEPKSEPTPGTTPEPTPKDGVLKEVKFLDVQDYAKWTYYSFKENKVVKVADYQEDLSNDQSWDIAFHRWDVRTNSGTSGKGKGGAFKSDVTTLDAAKDLKPALFTEDIMGEIIVSFNRENHEMKKEKASINPVMSNSKGNIGWIDTTHGAMGPKYEISPNVYFIRTADGQVVAVKFKHFRNAENATGFITFDYMYVKQ